jgi:hypothetical protein
MSKAYKCQMSGKLFEGDGVQNFVANVSPGFALLIIPQEVVSPKKTEQATISPEAAETIKSALATLAKK